MDEMWHGYLRRIMQGSLPDCGTIHDLKAVRRKLKPERFE
jgi:hypothetical protein